MADNTDFDRIQYLNELGEAAVRAERVLSRASTAVKNDALLLAAKLLKEREAEIIGANATDVDAAAARGMSVSMQDRLRLTTKRIDDIAEGLRQVAALPDPVGDVLDGGTRPNGLRIVKTRVPLGVLGIIYEARPNVTADAAALCVKSGNACILRGGKEAINSNKAVAAVFREALGKAGLPENCVQLITDTSRETAAEFMKLDKYVDVLIPRGGAGLINAVLTQATVPVIQTGTGNCHVYVDKAADLDMAEKIVVNAKTQRPSVCNAMETLLVHIDVANEFLPRICRELAARNVELRVCEKSKKILTAAGFDAGTLKDATETDWATEYDDLILAVKVVDSLEEAIEHVSAYTTHHSEAIVTRDYNAASEFQLSIDAACVYVNASTRFTDGFEFGLGAEIGISNQKLHTRGPMGLKELTTVKYLINGNGQIRG
jgi:glutamate-5-semialdehyde dehydrogenase